MCENRHHISKRASNELFELSKKWFHKLYMAKELEGVAKRTPQFIQIRNSLYKKKVPQVYLEIAYRNKNTKEVVVLKDQLKTPTRRFPPNQFEKLFEIASVKVSYFLSCS